jgi:hypothetical protein
MSAPSPQAPMPRLVQPTNASTVSPPLDPTASSFEPENSDLDSQMAGPTEVSAKALTFASRVALTEEQLDYVRRLDLDPVEDPDAKRNPHGCAATERYAAEIMVMQDIRDSYPDGSVTVIDVGSNGPRTVRAMAAAGLDAQFFGLIPPMVRNDGHRQAMTQRARLPYCRHKLQDCTCVTDVEFPVYSFCHSLYYIRPEELIQAMLRDGVQRAYAILHDYKELAGSVCNGEVHYKMDLQGNYTTMADGDDARYVHPPLDWLHLLGINAHVDDTPFHLTWRTMAIVGDTKIIVFDISQQVGPSGWPDTDVTWIDGVTPETGASNSFAAALNATSHKVGVEHVYVETTSAIFLPWRISLGLGNGIHVAMPRQLPYEIARICVGLTRTPDTYQTALAAAKRALSKLNLDPEVSSRAVMYAAIAALSLLVEEETLALGWAANSFSRLWQQHEQSVMLRPLRLLTRADLIDMAYVSSFTLPPIIYYHVPAYFFQAGVAVAGVAVLHPFIAAAAVGCAGIGIARQVRGSMAHLRRQDVYVASAAHGVASSVATTLHLGGPVGRPGVLKPKPITRKSVGRIWSVGEPTRKQLAPPSGARTKLVGIGFSGIGVLAVEKSNEAVIAALETRLLSETLERETPGEWHKMIMQLHVEGSLVSKFVQYPVEVEDEDVQEYLNTRTPSQRKALTAALLSLKEKPITKGDCKVQVLLKLEKSTLLHGDWYDEFDPRPVLGQDPRVLATTCFWHFVHNKHWRAPFTEYDPWYIPIGDSTEQLGSFHDTSLGLLYAYAQATGDEVLIIEDDVKRQDVCTGKGANEFCWETDRLNGAPADLLFVQREVAQPRGTIQGTNLKFSCDDYKRVSGGSDTIKGNTKTNSADRQHMWGNPSWTTYVGAVIGDDTTIFTLKSFYEKVQHVKSKLGFVRDVIVHTDPRQLTFCKMRPYPSRNGTVYGPMIGRIMVHHGSTVSTNPDVYGASVGLEASVAHIPFLKEFIDVHRRLSSPNGHNKREYAFRAKVPHGVSPEIWSFLESVYGLSKPMLADFVSLLSGVQSIPAVITWPMIGQLVARDA